MFSVLNIAVLLVSLHHISCSKEEANVIKKLKETTDPDVRPGSDASAAVEINVEFYLSSIIELDEVKPRVVLSLNVVLKWTDSSLAWTPFSSQIKKLVIPACNVWIPELVLDSVQSVVKVRMRETAGHDVTIAPNGEVYYIRPVSISLPLKKNGDNWEASFTLDPWHSDKTLQKLKTPMTKMDVSQFTDDNYELKSNSLAIKEVSTPDVPGEVYMIAEVKLGFHKK